MFQSDLLNTPFLKIKENYTIFLSFTMNNFDKFGQFDETAGRQPRNGPLSKNFN